LNKHIFIATPMYGGQCFGNYHTSMILMQKTLLSIGVAYTQSAMFNESLIQRARNGLAHAFMQTECTHLMFIDADIAWNPEQFPPMLAADKDIICGIYPKKEISWPSVRQAIAAGVPDEQLKHHTGSFVVNLANHATSVTAPMNEPLEIMNGGTGFMLIKREVFETLQQTVATYKNNVTDLGGNLHPEMFYEYFGVSIDPDTNVLLSEDYYFCTIARKAGFKVYAAPWVDLSHNGFYSFEGRLVQSP